MHAIEELLVRQACAELIALYALLNDERRYEELADLFTEDATLFRPSSPDQPIRGRAAILEAFRKRPDSVVTFHVTSDVLVEASAAGVVQVRSKMLMFAATRGEAGSNKAPVAGTFHDTVVSTPDGWKFSQRRGALVI
ncbi:ketosteroid isomerase-like protein [Massilia sp. UYP11]|uniref:nuclear transport factor 2 family protein n=1 Tax=Massilia sp. UYP11 TaxID=1756385 RepID=UPI003D25E932